MPASLGPRRVHRAAGIAITLLIVLGAVVGAWAASGGTLDPGFNPNVNGDVNAIATQPDGKVLIGGEFTTVGGTARNNVARLNADGTLDASFNPNVNNGVLAIAVQPDGKVLIGGGFRAVGGTPRTTVARLNADGTLDASFNPDANEGVTAIAVQSDGKVLIGGAFTAVGGSERTRVARLNADGTLDNGFIPDVNRLVYAVATHTTRPDVTVLIGGDFYDIAGMWHYFLARLDSQGGPDGSFHPDVNGPVGAIAVQPDGKVLIGGKFTAVGGATHNRVARLNTDGTVDGSFNSAMTDDGVVLAIATQPDGKVLIGGGFSTIGGATRNNVARLNADGTLDASFNPNVNKGVVAIATQPDGKVLIGGAFTTAGGVTRNHLARVLGGAPSAAPTAVVAVAGDNQAAVAWKRVIGKITSHTVTAAPDGRSCTAAAPATSCTVTGLADGTSYTFTATAANQFGAGPASAPSAPVTTAPAGATAAVAATVLVPRTHLMTGQSLRIAVRTASTGTATAIGVTSCLVLPAGFSVLKKGSALRTGKTLCFRRTALAPGRTATSLITVRATALTTGVRTISGSARATGAGLTKVLAAPHSVTITPNRG